MINKLVYFLLFLLLFGKTQGQTSTIVYVYDTIVVHDTLYVYDTIRVSDKDPMDSFKNITTIQNAYLAIDTATSKAQLFFFNEKDTATLSINSILLSESNKNLDTMKKLILTLAASGLLMQTTYAQTTKTNTDLAPYKKIAVGIGVSTHSVLYSPNFGGNIKLDYLLTKKFSIGIKSIITSYNYESRNNGWLNSSIISAPVIYKPGRIINISLISSYYILGKNQSSKAGLYVTAEVGYNDLKRKYTYNNNEGFIYIYRVKTLSGLVGLGGDFKIGPGRMYIETPVSFTLFGTETYDYPTIDGKKTVSNKSKPSGSIRPFVNLGYTLFF